MRLFSKRDEERLIEAGRQYYSTAFPNPERVGCPGAEVLKALALGELDRPTAKKWDSHMRQCSPCFNEYVALREGLERLVYLRRLATVAAVILVAMASWLVFRAISSRRAKHNELTAHNTGVTYHPNRLDLRNQAALRGAEPNKNASPSVLPPEPLALSIYLPSGSEPGNYEVQVTEGPSQPLLTAQGNASLQDHIAVLEVKLDLQRLHPGQYLFWIRQAGTSWSYYPVILKSGS